MRATRTQTSPTTTQNARDAAAIFSSTSNFRAGALSSCVRTAPLNFACTLDRKFPRCYCAHFAPHICKIHKSVRVHTRRSTAAKTALDGNGAVSHRWNKICTQAEKTEDEESPSGMQTQQAWHVRRHESIQILRNNSAAPMVCARS